MKDEKRITKHQRSIMLANIVVRTKMIFRLMVIIIISIYRGEDTSKKYGLKYTLMSNDVEEARGTVSILLRKASTLYKCTTWTSSPFWSSIVMTIMYFLLCIGCVINFWFSGLSIQSVCCIPPLIDKKQKSSGTRSPLCKCGCQKGREPCNNKNENVL